MCIINTISVISNILFYVCLSCKYYMLNLLMTFTNCTWEANILQHPIKQLKADHILGIFSCYQIILFWIHASCLTVIFISTCLAKEWYEQQLQTMRTICHYCHNSKASILLLPCAHLACCNRCLQGVRRCPVATCNKVVRGTKEVFFV